MHLKNTPFLVLIISRISFGIARYTELSSVSWKGKPLYPFVAFVYRLKATQKNKQKTSVFSFFFLRFFALFWTHFCVLFRSKMQYKNSRFCVHFCIAKCIKKLRLLLVLWMQKRWLLKVTIFFIGSLSLWASWSLSDFVFRFVPLDLNSAKNFLYLFSQLCYTEDR